MLDEALVARLREVFGALESRITLVLSDSEHDKQAELLDLARQLAETSPRIDLRIDGPRTGELRLSIHREGEPTGLSFRGVPGGHEFTSLVLAVLHADGKGKMPDEGLRARIRALRGPAKLRTYVSLSCTNCPDVVQAMGQITVLHPELEHEMVDGELYQAEVEALGLQGVPAVALLTGDGAEILHVGKSTLGELLGKLEQKLGKHELEAAPSAAAPKRYDVVVLGGGPAGVSAAIYTARKGLSTAIVAERLGGQLKDTLGIENLVGTKYTEGARLAADLETHLRSYPVDVLLDRRVERVFDQGPEKLLEIEGGERIAGGSLIVATGAKWRELGVPGERAYLGRGVAFCPHCEGPFYKGRPVAVVGGGNSGVEAAIDLAGIVSHVTVVEFAAELKADAVLVEALKQKPNVTIITNAKTTEVVGDGQKVHAMRYEDRATGEARELAVEGVFVQIGLLPNSAMVADLVERTPWGEIVVDAHGRTSRAGVYAAGDVTTVPFKQIVIAIGEGAKAALGAFEDRMRAAA